jgi:hypothetical protein
MPSRIGSAGWNDLLDDLEKLQTKWEAKMPDLVERGRAMWLHGVVFGIEIGRRRMAEEEASSLTALDALLDEWESIGKLKANGPAAESIKGIDFGIRLVISPVRRYLNRLARPKPPASTPVRPKPPTSVNNSKAVRNSTSKRGSQS